MVAASVTSRGAGSRRRRVQHTRATTTAPSPSRETSSQLQSTVHSLTKTRRYAKQRRTEGVSEQRASSVPRTHATAINRRRYPHPQEEVASDEELLRRRKKLRTGGHVPGSVAPKPVFAIGTTQKSRSKNRKKLSNKEKQRLKQAARDTHARSSHGFPRRASSSASVRKLLTLRLGESDLDGDLAALAQFVTPTPRERAFRTRVFQTIQSLIEAHFPDASVALYGSSSSGMETFRSDLDITVGNLDFSRMKSRGKFAVVETEEEDDGHEIVNAAGYVVSDTDEDEAVEGDDDSEPTFSLNLALPTSGRGGSTSSIGREEPAPLRAASTPLKSPWNGTLRRQKLRQLRALQQLLSAHRPEYKIQCLSKAKIPILVLTDPQSGLHIDLGVNREALQASDHGRTTTLVAQLQHALGAPFFHVVAFLRELLHQFELDKPFTGGLGSYRLYMMVAYIFTTRFRTSPVSPGKVLLTFLQVFGNRKARGFWTTATELPVRHGELLDIVDFHAVFRLDDCVDKFAMAFDLIRKHQSVACIVYEETLEAERRACAKRILQQMEREEEEQEEEEEDDDDSSDEDECFL